MAILEFRVSLTVSDYDKLLVFYKNSLDLETVEQWDNEQGRGVIFDVGKATLELLDEKLANSVDQIEAGKRVSGQVRFAIQVPELGETTDAILANGGAKVYESVMTPWGDHNQRVQAPDGLQITLFKR
jgi:methylmalonyl-CoA/ethylmalonyl-CoA epimerase